MSLNGYHEDEYDEMVSSATEITMAVVSYFDHTKARLKGAYRRPSFPRPGR